MDKQKPVEFTVANRTVIRILLIMVATFLGLRFLLNVSHVLSLIFFAFFLSMALNPAVAWISRHLRIKSRAGATGVAYIVVLTLIISLFSVIIPPLVSQTSDFVTSLPQTIRSVNNQDSAVGRLVKKYQLQDSVDKIASDMSGRLKNLPGPVLSTAGKIGSTLTSTIAVLVLTFMMIVEGPMWLTRFWALQPKSHREHGQKLAMRMYGVITGYVNGQVLIAFIAASFALVAMLIASNIFGVSINAVGLAGIIALTGLIPMIGNTLGAVIVVLVCALSSLPLSIVMAIFFLMYQQIENVTIQPYIQSKKNELTPLLVFIAAMLGIGIGGLLGAFVAIPLAGCIRILLNDYYKMRVAQNA
ncbi:MAG: AI-2E family transporter [Candidatus Saccharibacteria bacterium]